MISYLSKLKQVNRAPKGCEATIEITLAILFTTNKKSYIYDILDYWVRKENGGIVHKTSKPSMQYLTYIEVWLYSILKNCLLSTIYFYDKLLTLYNH